MTHDCLHPWLHQRSSGVLAHLTSLPGQFGIGNLGQPALQFVDFLAATGFAYWQICPVGPTGYGDSPYQSFSTFAGNPYLIDLQELLEAGLLSEEEVAPLRALPASAVDFGGLYEQFWPVLQKAADRFDPVGSGESTARAWHHFIATNAHWLEPYALFMALKQLHGGQAWTSWESPYRLFSAIDRAALPASVLQDQQRHMRYQFWFFQQWFRLKRHANEHGVQLIGDVPIFVAHDSADVWQHPQVFRIDRDGQLIVSAGVPPDYYSALGQYWGNPLYDWDYLKKTGYRWWVERMRGSFTLVDLIRLDHFRGFSTYWEIPAEAPDARSGRWVKGPGFDLFREIHRQLPDVKVIAEDLGYIDQAVFDLRQQCGYPGMKILQFGFGHDVNNANLPHYYPRNSVVYPGTHDNDTTRGWLEKLSPEVRSAVDTYYRLGGETAAWPFVHASLASVSDLAVVPLQDLLECDSSGRLNTPGTSSGNWTWRMSTRQFAHLRHVKQPFLHELLRLTGRIDDGRQHQFSAPPEEEPTGLAPPPRQIPSLSHTA